MDIRKFVYDGVVCMVRWKYIKWKLFLSNAELVYHTFYNGNSIINLKYSTHKIHYQYIVTGNVMVSVILLLQGNYLFFCVVKDFTMNFMFVSSSD